MNLPDRYVLDCSAALSWLFEDESSPMIDSLLDALPTSTAIVPDLWYIELANSLNVAIKRKRLDVKKVEQIIDRVLLLPIHVSSIHSNDVLTRVRKLAKQHGLSVYDAVYLDLALQLQMPLATLDEKLKTSAHQEGIAVIG